MNKFLTHSKNLLVPVTASFLLFGCGGSSDSTSDTTANAGGDTVTDTTTTTTDPEPNTAGDLAVTINSFGTDAPVENTTVTLHSRDTGAVVDTATTDSNGVATFSNATSGAIYNVSVAGDGYASGSFPITAPLESDTTTSIELSMVPVDHEEEFSGSTGATIAPGSVVDGAQVVIPPNAFLDSNGDVVTGPIRVEMTAYDVTDQDLLDQAYVSLDAELSNGSIGQLYTYGAVDYTFFSVDTGEELSQMADGSTAVITIPIYIEEHQGTDAIETGDYIGLWWMDETVSIWKEHEIGCAVVTNPLSPTGFACQGEVDHFTTWNVDWEQVVYGTTTDQETDVTYSLTLENEISANITFTEAEDLEEPVCVSFRLANDFGSNPVGVICSDRNGITSVNGTTTEDPLVLNVNPNSGSLTNYCIEYQFNTPVHTGAENTGFSLGNASNNASTTIEQVCYQDEVNGAIQDILESASVTTVTTIETSTTYTEEWECPWNTFDIPFNTTDCRPTGNTSEDTDTSESSTTDQGDGTGIRLTLDANLTIDETGYIIDFFNVSIVGY